MTSATTHKHKAAKPAKPAKAQPALACAIASQLVATKSLKGRKAFEAFRHNYRDASVPVRVQIERAGVPFEVVKVMVTDIGMSDAEFQRTVRIPKATFAKKMKERTALDGVVGQSAIHIMELVNKVEEMVSVDPDPEGIKGFDAAKWVGDWIRTPQPGLGGIAPADLLDTPTGRESVMRLLGSIQSGAYQ